MPNLDYDFLVVFIHIIQQNYPSRVADIPEALVHNIYPVVKIEPKLDLYTSVHIVLVRDYSIVVP